MRNRQWGGWCGDGGCGRRRDTWVPPYRGMFCRAGPACPAGDAVRSGDGVRAARYTEYNKRCGGRADECIGPYGV